MNRDRFPASRGPHRAALLAALTLALAFPPPAAAEETGYDPLALSVTAESIQTLDLIVEDPARKRTIPLRVYLPPASGQVPVVLFSHGLGGSREASPYLGRHWAARGYQAVFLQHPGSDDAIWREARLGRRFAAMEGAATGENLVLRAGDVSATLDALSRWNGEAGHPLEGRLDRDHIGMSGHSFGALTTQAAGGQTFPGGRSMADPRVRAAIMFSPSAPRRGDPGRAFGDVSIPWLLMTGTEDIARIGGADVASRLAGYPALPPGGKYELVLHGAEHSAFTDRALPGDRNTRNPNHHRAILALSTAFWDAWLRDDSAARAWLDGPGPATILEAQDRWQRK